MGERVVVGREPPLAQEAPPGASSTPPLNYGRSGGRFEGLRRDAQAWVRAAADAVAIASATAWPRVKRHWRQGGFALGLSLALAGLGMCVNRDAHGDEGIALMFLGGVLIGICVRVPERG